MSWDVLAGSPKLLFPLWQSAFDLLPVPVSSCIIPPIVSLSGGWNVMLFLLCEILVGW